LDQRTTVFDAINNTGGFDEFALKNDIKIIRGEQVFHFNYERVRMVFTISIPPACTLDPASHSTINCRGYV